MKRILISLGILLDTDIRRAVAAFCEQLKITPAQAVPILQAKNTQELIQRYKSGLLDSDAFFTALKEIIAANGVDISAAEAVDTSWVLNCWNAQTKIDEARLAQVKSLAEESELFIFSDTNPAHMAAIGGVSILLEMLGIGSSHLFLSYELKHLEAYDDAFKLCFAEKNPDKPVIFIDGPSAPLQTPAEAALHRGMLEKAASAADGKDPAQIVIWDGKENLATLIDTILPSASLALG